MEVRTPGGAVHSFDTARTEELIGRLGFEREQLPGILGVAPRAIHHVLREPSGQVGLYADFVEALGCNLELFAQMPGLPRIPLNLGQTKNPKPPRFHPPSRRLIRTTPPS